MMLLVDTCVWVKFVLVISCAAASDGDYLEYEHTKATYDVKKRSAYLKHPPKRTGSSVANKEALKLFFGEKQKKNKLHGSWAWDTTCHLQPLYGTHCMEPVTRYYYNLQIDQCVKFNYTGCASNKNNFDAVDSCERLCKGTSFFDFMHGNRTIICSLQHNAGVCLGYFRPYYYDINTRTCKIFSWGGCGGNQNRFKTRAQCMTYCEIDSDRSESAPPDDIAFRASEDTYETSDEGMVIPVINVIE